VAESRRPWGRADLLRRFQARIPAVPRLRGISRGESTPEVLA
jgi:hypothetical protein